MKPPTNSDDHKSLARKLSSLYDESDSAGVVGGAIYFELQESRERYKDSAVIASGAMKQVSRVFDSRTGRHIAMAELRENADSELFEPFLREARLTSLLEHRLGELKEVRKTV